MKKLVLFIFGLSILSVISCDNGQKLNVCSNDRIYNIVSNYDFRLGRENTPGLNKPTIDSLMEGKVGNSVGLPYRIEYKKNNKEQYYFVYMDDNKIDDCKMYINNSSHLNIENRYHFNKENYDNIDGKLLYALNSIYSKNIKEVITIYEADSIEYVPKYYNNKTLIYTFESKEIVVKEDIKSSVKIHKEISLIMGLTLIHNGSNTSKKYYNLPVNYLNILDSNYLSFEGETIEVLPSNICDNNVYDYKSLNFNSYKYFDYFRAHLINFNNKDCLVLPRYNENIEHDLLDKNFDFTNYGNLDFFKDYKDIFIEAYVDSASKVGLNSNDGLYDLNVIKNYFNN